MKLLLVVGAATLVATSAAHAQSGTSATIAPDADVRATMVSGPDRRLTGKFIAMSADTLTLSRHGAVFSIPVAQLHRLEVRGARNPWRGARWGAGIVGGIAVVFGGIDAARGRLGGGEYVGTIVGNALIGGLLGYAIAPRSWVEVPRQIFEAGAAQR